MIRFLPDLASHRTALPLASSEDLQATHELFRLITENVKDLIAVVDFNGRRLFNSRSYRPILGDPESLKGTDSFGEIHPDDRERIKTIFEETVRTGVGQRAEYRFVRPDGTVRYIESEGNVIQGDGDASGRVVIISRDVTERKQAEDALRASEKRFRALIENISDAIVLVDAEGFLRYASPSTERLLGYSTGELVGMSFFDLVESREVGEMMELFVEVRERPKKTVSMSSRLVNKNTEAIWVEGVVMNLLEEPEVECVVVNFRDVTELHRLEEDLRQMQKMESLGQLAGGVAHDFNNILAIIMGYVSALGRMPHSEERLQQSVQVIGEAARRGAGIVRQLLMFARKTEPVFEPVYLNDVIKTLTSMLKETFPRTIEFVLRLEDRLPPIVGDLDQIHQMLVNLAVNARDAMMDERSNGVKKILTITTSKIPGTVGRQGLAGANASDYIQLTISDTGHGMDQETRQRIFEPFFTTKDREKGTGLGLAVVFGIVQSHRGHIEVQSNVGVGTSMIIRFPVPESLQPLRVAEQDSLDEEVGGHEKILVVEDEEKLLELLRGILESEGYSVLTAKDGYEAVAVFSAFKGEIDAVVSDLGLPRLSGLEAFIKMREISPHVPLILASGYLDAQMRSRLAGLRIDSFIEKPYMEAELLRCLRSELDRYSADRPVEATA